MWDYNDVLSVDAATGRPEQAAPGATQRPVPRDAGNAPRGSAPGGGREGGGVGGGLAGDPRRAMSALLAAERRTLVRDLLEVPEQLKIRATVTDVTFIDDLQRGRTYSTNGALQKYHLSAAQFDARAGWYGSTFRKDIEGPNDFKMTETYFLGEAGDRLYVIVRVGDPKKPETLAGVNRVYDRVGDRLAR